jgi:cytosine/adenosine deaminase-related metal-dependent hydrolase
MDRAPSTASFTLGGFKMCILCESGKPQDHGRTQLGRRDFLKASTATAAGAAALGLFSPRPAAARGDDDPPRDGGRHGRRYVIRNGHVMSMDPAVGDIVRGDVLVEGKRIVAVERNIHAPGADEIDAEGRIVMPGFVDTHHHQFETAIRSFLADGLLFNDGQPHGTINYFQYILGTFAPVYRPRDVYINELFGSLSQLDAGVTTSHDISQIHYTQQHSDAAIKGSADSGRRIVFGYFEGARADLQGSPPGATYPGDARRIKKQFFSSSDQLMTMSMGGEIYLQPAPAVYTEAWKIGRELGIPVVAHIVGSFGMQPEFDLIATGQRAVRFGPDNLFIHMTGMSNVGWQAVKDAGAHVSLAVPIEMNMRHGTPPILKTLDIGVEPSLSVDVEVTLTADMFTQMRSAMTLQRMFVNAAALGEPYAAGFPSQELLTSRDVLRFATMQGAKDLHLDRKVGSLTPGKEADIIILDAEAINVAPLNVVPGAVVSLMERSNVETVIVAGKVRKWKGKLLDVDLRRLRNELENSRDYVFKAAGVPQDLFRPN